MSSGSLSASACDQERVMRPTQSLPFHLIIEILLRLPVRSVLRFKCVCKPWLSLISDPQFAISHHDLTAAPTHRLLLRSDDFYLVSVDVEAPLSRFIGALRFRIPPPPPTPYDVFDYYADYHGNAKPEILGSCRGLVLIQYWKASHLIIWNPITDACERLKVFEHRITYSHLFGFGYDPSTDDYLLVAIALEIESHPFSILSFKTSLLDCDHMRVSYRMLGDVFRAGSLLHESLHWLVFSEDKQLPVILAFDLVQKSFSEIPLLDDLTTEIYEPYGFRVIGGCLVVCCSVRNTETAEIWVMKQYNVHTSWTKSVVLHTHGISHNYFSPLCITKDGGFFGSNIIGTLEKLNDKGELLEDLPYSQARRLYIDNLQAVTYTESLLTASVIGGNKENQGIHSSSCIMGNPKLHPGKIMLSPILYLRILVNNTSFSYFKIKWYMILHGKMRFGGGGFNLP